MRALAGVLLLVLLLPGSVQGYPLDGTEYTGIRRLEAARAAQQARPRLAPGALLPLEAVRPSGIDAVALPAPDPVLSAQLRRVLGGQAANYGVAVLDLTDPQRPLFAAHQPDYQANVGSVGKLLVLLAWMQELADLYPDDIAARERVLRTTQVVADAYIQNDHHVVPIFDRAAGRVRSRRLVAGDEGTLWEFMDWMMSASSNAAASMVMKELAAIEHFGRDYPPAQAPRNALLDSLSPAQRGGLLRDALMPPLARHGLDPARIRQGSLFTRAANQRMTGTTSYATPVDLVRLLALIEANRFVDAWSSREAKRLLYMTQRRIRYASHPVLNPAAVYFKSGSLYACQPEPGFRCGKYMGNKVNRLASVALVEYPAESPRLRYAVTVMSNVLRVNSAVAHQTLALRIHRLIEERHAPRPAAADRAQPATGVERAERKADD